jgi:hypothetical protein
VPTALPPLPTPPPALAPLPTPPPPPPPRLRLPPRSATAAVLSSKRASTAATFAFVWYNPSPCRRP